MSRRRPGTGDELEIEFEGFDRALDDGAADVTLGHAPFGHGRSPGGRRWPFVLAAIGAVTVMVWFLATRHDEGSPEAAQRGATQTTPDRSSDRTAGSTTRAPATTKPTTVAPRSATVVTIAVGGAPLMGAPTGRTLHFTDQGASVSFSLDVDSGQLRQVPVKAGIRQAVVTPGRVVGITDDGRLAIVGNDGHVEVESPAVGLAGVGDGSVWVAVPDDGHLRLNHLVPASDLVTESRLTPGPALALAGSDAHRNPVVLGADGHPYTVTGDGTAELLSSGSMASHAFGTGNQVVAGAYADMSCSVQMVCTDVLHAANGQLFQLKSTDPSARSYSFSPDGKRVAVNDAAAHRIEVFDFSGRPPFVVDVVDVVDAGAGQTPVWSPDGRYVFTYLDRRVRWGDVSTGRTGSFELTRPGVALVLFGVE